MLSALPAGLPCDNLAREAMGRNDGVHPLTSVKFRVAEGISRSPVLSGHERPDCPFPAQAPLVIGSLAWAEASTWKATVAEAQRHARGRGSPRPRHPDDRRQSNWTRIPIRYSGAELSGFVRQWPSRRLPRNHLLQMTAYPSRRKPATHQPLRFRTVSSSRDASKVAVELTKLKED